jgi:hypothetical protein
MRVSWLDVTEVSPSLSIARKEHPMNQSIISVDLVASALRSEDLGTIPREVLARDAADYERFLLLAQRYPFEPLAPTRAIDRMWHLHMLHPRQYAADCDQLFGDLLDHNGGFGATPEEAPLLTAAFAKTSVLWKHEFGTEYTDDGSDIVACTRNCVSRCQRRCSSSSVMRGD